MEPTIKSEPCEELYSEQESNYQVSNASEGGGTTSEPSQRVHNLKRLYKELEEDNSVTSKRVNQQQPNDSYNQSFEFPSAPQHLQDGINIQEANQNATLVEKQLKKYKTIVLFNAPFFNLVEELISRNSAAIAARCYSCGKVVKGNRGISSNFIKHMKRAHPETYKLYDGYKSHKTKSYYLPNLPEILTRKSAPVVENGASGSDSTTANDDTNQFSENSTVLETTGLNDSSDDNEQVSKNHMDFSDKTLTTLGNIIDEKLKIFFKQNEYVRLNEKGNTLTNANQTCDVDPNTTLAELRIELDNLKKECSDLRSAVQKSQASKRQLQNELQTVDKLLYQRKLMIKNIAVCDPEQPLKSIKKLFNETMHLENIKIVHCCVIPSVKPSMVSNKENVSIELANPHDCKAIFRQTHTLKNTGIFIESEISPFQRKRKNKLMVLRKELLRRKSDLKVLLRGTNLVVNGKNFYWDDVEGLCHDYKYEALNFSGVEYLKVLTGLDLNEFVTFLQNYNVQMS